VHRSGRDIREATDNPFMSKIEEFQGTFDVRTQWISTCRQVQDEDWLVVSKRGLNRNMETPNKLVVRSDLIVRSEGRALRSR
jgi:hypothetical protein